MLGRHFLLPLASLLLLVSLLFAQSAPHSAPVAASGKPITVSVNEVIVPVTVTDDKGRFVSDLDQKDFKIVDGGREQTIRYFTRERNQPVVVGFLMDASNASRMHWKNYQEAAEELVLNLLPNDKKYSGYLISYANEAELQVNTTSDPEKILEKLRKMKNNCKKLKATDLNLSKSKLIII